MNIVSACSFSPCRSAAIPASLNHSRESGGQSTSFSSCANADAHNGRIVRSANFRIAASYIE